MALVSIVVPAYNASGYLRGALQSVLTQSMQDFEIVIVDDGSTDQTISVIQPYLSDSRVHYMFQQNRGLPAARNAGAMISTGKYLAFLDADDFLAPRALETMCTKFDETGAAWSIVGVLKVEGEKKTVRPVILPAGDLFLQILADDFVTRSPFYPRNEFFDVGMYDEEMKVREDWDLNIRMIASGKRFVIIDEPLYVYTRSEGSITTGNRRRVHAYTEKLLHKHHKALADAGNHEIAHIYAKNMWNMARSSAYELRDFPAAFRYMRESLKYDMSVARLFHPFLHRIESVFARR